MADSRCWLVVAGVIASTICGALQRARSSSGWKNSYSRACSDGATIKQAPRCTWSEMKLAAACQFSCGAVKYRTLWRTQTIPSKA